LAGNAKSLAVNICIIALAIFFVFHLFI